MSSFIGTLAVVIIVPLVLGWLFRSTKNKARKDGDKQWLEYGKTMKGFALFFVAIVIALGGFWVQASPEDCTPIVWSMLFFGCLTTPLVIEFFFVRIAFDSNNIYCFSGWRRCRVIPWTSIKSCRFSATNKWWVIDTESHGKIRIHEFLSGRDTFFEVLASQTGITV